MKLTDKEIVQHLIYKGRIKRSFWKDVYVDTSDDGRLQINYKNRAPYTFEVSVTALAASDWEWVVK